MNANQLFCLNCFFCWILSISTNKITEVLRTQHDSAFKCSVNGVLSITLVSIFNQFSLFTNSKTTYNKFRYFRPDTTIFTAMFSSFEWNYCTYFNIITNMNIENLLFSYINTNQMIQFSFMNIQLYIARIELVGKI